MAEGFHFIYLAFLYILPGKKAPKRVKITKLKDVPTKQSFVEVLDVRLDTILLNEQDVEAAWITLRDSI